MKKRQLLLVMIMLFTLVVATQVSLSQGRGNGNKNKNTNTSQNNGNNGNNGNSGNNGGNADCPAGTTEVAKFNYNGGYVLEYGGGVTINGNASGGTWSSTSFISHIVVKGGNGNYIANIVPVAQSGTFTNFGLPLVGNGNTPGISNIKFCAGEQPTPTPVTPTPTPVTPTPTPVTPTPTPDITCAQAIAAADPNNLRIVSDGFDGTTYTYTIRNNTSKDFPVGVAVYRVYGPKPSNSSEADLDTQQLDNFMTTIAPAGGITTVTVTATVPNPFCAYQVDVFCGPVLYQLSNTNAAMQYGPNKIMSADGGFIGALVGPDDWQKYYCGGVNPPPTN
jgi:hypothetical protein